MNFTGFNPNVDYTEYKFRLCGCGYEYCDGKCSSCAKANTTVSNKTEIDPTLLKTTTTSTIMYNTKNYTYDVDYRYRDSISVPETGSFVNYRSNSRTSDANFDLNPVMLGPWSYYRTMYGWKGDLLV